MLPNGNTMISTHTANLNIPTIPMQATQVHIFPDMEGSTPLLSIGNLCDHGCIATYDKDKVIIKRNNEIILIGYRHPVTKLWMIDFSNANSPTMHSSAASTIVHHDITTAQRVAFFHAAMGSPVISTLLDAMDRGFINIPAFTQEMIKRNLPVSTATSKGHLDRTRSGIQSTRPPVSTLGEKESKDEVMPTTVIQTKTNIVRVKLLNSDQVTGRNYNDMTGRFPVTSITGKNYMLVMYNVDANYIHIEAMNDRSGPQYRAAYERGYEYFRDRGFPIIFEHMDNEVPLTVLNYCRDNNVTIQIVPPDNHRTNRAERAIRTFKNHAIASLCSSTPDFPEEAWDETLPQIELTLNLLRASHVNPYISAWQQLNGPYKYLETPIAPIGTRVMVFVPPEKRESWAPHALKGWYVGPSFIHYRCYRVYIEKTKSVRVTDSIQWLNDPINLPGSSPIEVLSSAIKDLTQTLDGIKDIDIPLLDQRQPVNNLKERLMPALIHVREIFNPPKTISPKVISPPPGLAIQYPLPSHVDETTPPDHPAQRVETIIPRFLPPPPPTTTPPPPEIEHEEVGAEDPAPPAPAERVVPPAPDQPTGTHRSARLANKPRLQYNQLGKQSASAAMELDPSLEPKNYRAAIRRDDREQWLKASSEEMDRLVSTWDCLEFIPFDSKPKRKQASYYNPQVKLKVKDNKLVYRVRGTYGGNNMDYYGETAAKTAALVTVKVLLNAVVSDETSQWKTADIKDFYLTKHHRLKEPEYMIINLNQLPQDTISKYKLNGYQRNGKVMTKIKSALYGLPQSGRISQDHLILLLHQHGYYQCKNTPCLFKHETRDIQFVLVVDDFGIKYKNEED